MKKNNNFCLKVNNFQKRFLEELPLQKENNVDFSLGCDDTIMAND